MQRWLNRSICCLGCGLERAEGSTSSTIFARWRHCGQMGGHIGATWRIQSNRSSTVVMWFYVKLLWPLVAGAINVIIVIISKKKWKVLSWNDDCSGSQAPKIYHATTIAVMSSYSITSAYILAYLHHCHHQLLLPWCFSAVVIDDITPIDVSVHLYICWHVYWDFHHIVCELESNRWSV